MTTLAWVSGDGHWTARMLGDTIAAARSTRGSSVVEARVVSCCVPLELSRRPVLCDDTATVLIEETVTNSGPDPCPYLWGHHITFDQAVALALEPQSSDVPPLAPAVEAGNAPCLESGASTTAWLSLSLRSDKGGALVAGGGFP